MADPLVAPGGSASEAALPLCPVEVVPLPVEWGQAEWALWTGGLALHGSRGRQALGFCTAPAWAHGTVTISTTGAQDSWSPSLR